MAFAPRSGCATRRKSVYVPLLCESPLVSLFSAMRMYATCDVLPSHGIFDAEPSAGGAGQLHRLSPPDPSAASIAAITRSVIAAEAPTNAATAFGTTSPGRRML